MISNMDQRVLWYKANTQAFLDMTIKVNDYSNGLSQAITLAPGDFIYISSFLPFNHKFLKMSVLASGSEAPKIEVASSSAEWSEVADYLDFTGSLTSSGILQWTPDYDKAWGRVSRSNTDIQALANAPIVYDSYWLRISYPTVVTTKNFTLDYVGQLFSSDADLYAHYPNLRQPVILNGWKQGKTNWEEQHVAAADFIAKTLIQRKITLGRDQILDISTLRDAAVHKTAHIAYSGMGPKNYENEIKASAAAFDEAMRQDKFGVDTNMNARKDIADRIRTSSRATR